MVIVMPAVMQLSERLLNTIKRLPSALQSPWFSICPPEGATFRSFSHGGTTVLFNKEISIQEASGE